MRAAGVNDGRLATAGVLSALLLLSNAGGASAGDLLQGPARIVDGDTLYVEGQKVRLYAIDAPEKKQSCKTSKGDEYACGERSQQALQARVGSSPVRCEVKTKDQYGRNVAACSVLSGRTSEDMGQWLVANGHAVAYRKISNEYVAAEEKARAQHLGIWSGSFTMPAKWRYEHRLSTIDEGDESQPPPPPRASPRASSNPVVPGKTYADAAAAGAAAAAAAPAPGPTPRPAPLVPAGPPSSPPRQQQQQQPPPSGCAIKGNINSKGERIYHTPQSGAYDRTIVEPEKGERWFCTPQEAEAAGFRAAIR